MKSILLKVAVPSFKPEIQSCQPVTFKKSIIELEKTNLSLSSKKNIKKRRRKKRRRKKKKKTKKEKNNKKNIFAEKTYKGILHKKTD